jgi:hypothetical protein
MNSTTTNYADVFGAQATVAEIIERFNESDDAALEAFIEAEAVAMWGAEANDNDYAAMARQIEGELYQALETEAREAVKSAAQEPGVWFGRQNAEQVVFGNGVYTTACNGDGTDYADPDDAVAALANEWLRDSLKQR